MTNITKLPPVPVHYGHKALDGVTDLEGKSYPMFSSEEYGPSGRDIAFETAVTFHLKEWNGKTYAVRVTPRW